MKLIPNRAMLEGKRLLFCDDSIVRGTQLHDNVKVLYEYGAKEVHIRIACPPLIYSCPFVGFTASKSDMELITRRVIKSWRVTRIRISISMPLPAHPNTKRWWTLSASVSDFHP